MKTPIPTTTTARNETRVEQRVRAAPQASKQDGMRDTDKIGTVSSLCIYPILYKIQTKIWSFSRQNLTGFYMNM
jgi:hypothetical protein